MIGPGGTLISTFGSVLYKDLYRGVDVRFYGNNRELEYDVLVRPGADPAVVRFAYEGVEGLKITEAGGLEVILKEGKLLHKKPVIYQVINGERKTIDGSYRIIKGSDGSFTYGFEVVSYDHARGLVIDPVLLYSTYLGGSDADWGNGIAVDALGNAYVTGSTFSLDFPLSSPMQGSSAGVSDVYVTKINPAGTALVWSTYLGGSNGDSGNGIAVDAAGNVYIAGTTSSTDFPLMNPLQGVYGGGQDDAFIMKINSAGSALIYSTYLGGTLSDSSVGSAIDSLGAVYVTGRTSSRDFPLKNPLQGLYGGFDFDAFVTKINPSGSSYVYSTYLGGSSDETGFGIAVDSAGDAYVTGQTGSIDFPLMNPIQGTLSGVSVDAFITKIDPAGLSYVYSTYLGGFFYDSGNGIAVDRAGNAYVTGQTLSADFPLKNPLQGSFAGFADAFVTKINPAGTAIVSSTYIGGRDGDYGLGIAVDNTGEAYVTGYTYSTDFPLLNPVQRNFGGLYDGFILKMDSALSSLIFSTYLGGSGYDVVRSIAIDASDSAYVTGNSDSTDFPLMSPLQRHPGGSLDAFITKLSPPVVILAITPDAASVAEGSTLGYTVTATNTTPTRQCLQYWENVTLPDGSTYPSFVELMGPVDLCLNGGAQGLHI